MIDNFLSKALPIVDVSKTPMAPALPFGIPDLEVPPTGFTFGQDKPEDKPEGKPLFVARQRQVKQEVQRQGIKEQTMKQQADTSRIGANKRPRTKAPPFSFGTDSLGLNTSEVQKRTLPTLRTKSFVKKQIGPPADQSQFDPRKSVGSKKQFRTKPSMGIAERAEDLKQEREQLVIPIENLKKIPKYFKKVEAFCKNIPPNSQFLENAAPDTKKLFTEIQEACHIWKQQQDSLQIELDALDVIESQWSDQEKQLRKTFMALTS